MLEIIQWLFLLLLGCGVGWLWRDRSANKPPSWLAELSEEDLVQQSDLDQYHHRVVQLSHTQRDLLLRKIEKLEQRLAGSDSGSTSSIGQTPPPQVAKTEDFPETFSMGTEPHEVVDSPPWTSSLPRLRTEEENEDSGVGSKVPAEPENGSEQEASPAPIAIEDHEPMDLTGRVLKLWGEGRSPEEIARELRMGRQEVQLLIEMSRHSAIGASKG